MDHKIRSYRATDLDEVKTVLSPLQNYYPGFYSWLENKLVKPGVTAYIAEADDTIVGVVIGAPENRRTYKICTLFVHPDYRNRKIGSEFIHLMLQAATTMHAYEVFVTSDYSLLPTLGKFLGEHGFDPLSAENNKYYAGQTEVSYYKHL